MKPLLTLEGEHLRFIWNEDASAEIEVAATGARWRMGPVALQDVGTIDVGHVWLRTERSICETYPGRFLGELEGDCVRWQLLGREGRVVGTILTRATLSGDALRIEILEVDDSIPSLVFPTPLEAESLVFPRGVGHWQRKPIASRKFWKFWAHLNMRWFGGLKGEDGWLCTFEDGHHHAGVMAAEMTASPGWLRSLGQWTGPRTVSYRFLRGDYVDLALAFRRWAMVWGLHAPLADKIERCPRAANLVGGRIFSIMQARPRHPEFDVDRMRTVAETGAEGIQVDYTHRQTLDQVRKAQALGMERAMVVVRGWIAGGYDESHPDIWPPDPALGPIEDLVELCALDGNLTTALHDNYQDIYLQSSSWPNGANRDPEGNPMPGGLWAGGQAYILNSRDGLDYEKWNWDNIRTLKPGGWFLDTVTAVELYESYEEGNTLSRDQDEDYKRDQLRFALDQGLAVGSEEAADYAMDLVHWLENRHVRVPGESIPLWPLVYHDAAVCARYLVAPDSVSDHAVDRLWGYIALWGLPTRPLETHEALFRESLVVDRWHSKVGLLPMTAHRYLDAEGRVEQTEFGGNFRITANFGSEAFQGLGPGEVLEEG